MNAKNVIYGFVMLFFFCSCSTTKLVNPDEAPLSLDTKWKFMLNLSGEYKSRTPQNDSIVSYDWNYADLKNIENVVPIEILQSRAEQVEQSIALLNRILALEEEKFKNLHRDLEGEMRSAATDENININYYEVQAYRLQEDLSGLDFMVVTQFPDHLSKAKKRQYTLGLVKAFAIAMDRYQRTRKPDAIANANALELKLYGGESNTIANDIVQILGPTGMKPVIRHSVGEDMRLEIWLYSGKFYLAESERWLARQQDIQREVRVQKQATIEYR